MIATTRSWRILHALLAASAVWIIASHVLPAWINPFLHKIMPVAGPRPGVTGLDIGIVIRAEFGGVLAILIASLVALALESRRLTLQRALIGMNLPGSGASALKILPGVVVGALAMGAILLAIALTGNATRVVQDHAGVSVATQLLRYGLAFLLVSCAEELVYRGYSLRTLAQALGFWPATLLTSAAFGLMHLLNGDPWYGALGTTLRACFYCLMWRRTGSMAFGLGFHAAWDFVQSGVFGVADSGVSFSFALAPISLHGPTWLSGGAVGPEGSIFAYVTTMALLLYSMRPKCLSKNDQNKPQLRNRIIFSSIKSSRR